jgi:hypothetical protein
MMRAKNRMIGAIGAAVGLAMTLTVAVAPASARPGDATASVTATYSCASLEGLKVTAPGVSYSGVGLRTGETLTATVSPATTGDRILLVAATSFSLAISDGAATGPYSFRAGYDGVYSLGWSYVTPDGKTSTVSRTWTFDCSSTTVAAPAPQPAPTTEPAPTKRKGKPRP